METHAKVALFGGVYNNYLALETLLLREDWGLSSNGTGMYAKACWRTRESGG